LKTKFIIYLYRGSARSWTLVTSIKRRW